MSLRNRLDRYSHLVTAGALLLAWLLGWPLLAAATATVRAAARAPAATVQLCSLPGARIDAGDPTYEGDDIIVSGCQGEINGAHAFNSLTVQSGTLVHSPTLTMALTISTDVLIAADGALDVSGRGYAGGVASFGDGGGPGGGLRGDGAGGGGGHGGFGGGRRDYYGNYVLAGPAYGDVYQPVTRGSGGAGCLANSYCGSPGGDGGHGGGAVHLAVAGVLAVEGEIRADGGSATIQSGVIPGSGGAGGSIWLEAGSFTGSGRITADGGDGAGDRKIGGGGGRIAIYYGGSTFDGDLSARGGQTELGGGYTNYDYAAGAGTIYLRDVDETQGQMIVANLPLVNALLPPVATTPLDGGLVTAGEPHVYATFDISGTALVSTGLPVSVEQGSMATPGQWTIQGRFAGVTTTLGSGVALSVTSGTTETVGLLRTVFDGPLAMDAGQDIRIGGRTWLELREPLAVDEVFISGGSRLGHVAYRDGISPTLSLTANAVTVAADSEINVGGHGFRGAPAGAYDPGGGPGGGGVFSLYGSGGGHGGPGGGQAGGVTYGAVAAPVDLGSGGSAGRGGGGSSLGAGGHGGGRIHLNVAGAVTVEGGIYARGASGQDQQRDGGGGAGGSIYIQAGSLTGGGAIDARGGAGHQTGGGGGGGRIALDVTSNSFSGVINVAPGGGASPPAGIGTVIPGDLFSVSKTASPTPAVAGQVLTYTLTVNNNGTTAIMAEITDTLPLQVSATGPTSWSAAIPGGGQWMETLTVTVTDNASGTLTNLLQATVDGTTRSFTLSTPTTDSPISGLAAANSGPAVETQPVVFNASVVAGSGVTYAWDFGDGSSGQGTTASHAYAVQGTYTATVTASNNVSVAVAHTVVTVLTRPSFAGVVWLDADGDGVQGPGEPGLDGAAVTANGPANGSDTTNGGQWRIEGVPAGAYSVAASLAGHQPTTANPVSLPLPMAGSAQVSFGLRPTINGDVAVISGRLFADVDGDDLPDPDETTFAGRTVQLQSGGTTLSTAVTDANGLYQFSGVAAGAYDLEATPPAGAYPSPVRSYDVVAFAGQPTTAHLIVGGGGLVDGLVADVSGVPQAGVTLSLGQNGGVAVTTVTDATGRYQVGPLSPGDYDITIYPPPDLFPEDGAAARQVLVLSDATSTENWTLSRLGQLRVSVDYYRVGLGLLPVGGVGFAATSGTNIVTGSTNYNGEIVWSDLAPGTYTVTPDPATLPAEAAISPAARTAVVANDTSAGANFAVDLARVIRVLCRRAVPGYGGNFPCTVETYDAGGALVDTQSLPGGAATIVNLTDGVYEVFILPENPSWPDHSEVVAISDGTFAEVSYPFNPVSANVISGYAFNDILPPPGVRSTGTESGYVDANGLTIMLQDAGGQLVNTAVTGAANGNAGYFRFEGVAAGIYRVAIDLPAGYSPTTPTWAWRTVDLVTPPDALDFGFQRARNGAIDGLAFFDNDADGLYDPAVDEPRGGAPVALQTVSGTVLATTVTAPSGDFAFTNHASGEYVVRLDVPGNPTTLAREVTLPFDNPYAHLDYALPPGAGQPVLVYLDANVNGRLDTGEQRLGGVTVQRDLGACSSPFAAVDSQTTNSSGVAFFPAALDQPGCAVAAAGSLPPGVSMADPNGAPLPASPGVTWLAVVPGGTLVVRPFADTNGNSWQDATEPTLTGLTVTASGQSAVTGPDGALLTVSAGVQWVDISQPAHMQFDYAPPFSLIMPVEGAATLGVPLRYLGSVAGSVQASGGQPTWTSLTVRLEQTDGPYASETIVSQGFPGFQFGQAPPGNYRLTVAGVPTGWRLLSTPTFYYPAGATLVQSLTLVKLGGVSGVVYLDSNGNGNRNSGEPATSAYPVTLINDSGLPPQTIVPATDGSFSFPGLQPDVLYAVTLDLGGNDYAPDASITRTPGWFTVNSGITNVAIGLFPYAWPDDEYNLVYGRVTAGAPLAGVQVGYFEYDAQDGCDDPGGTTILGTAVTDAYGMYQLQTNIKRYTFPDGPHYCYVILDAPGFVPGPAGISEPSYTYPTTGGQQAVIATIFRRDLTATAAGSRAASGGAGTVAWSAFRDDNGNSLWDGTEPALPGTGLHGGGLSSLTGSAGGGILSGLAAGEHQLTLTPLPGYAPVGGEGSVTVWMTGDDLVVPPLGFRPAGALIGAVFADNDGDGWQGADEPGLGGVTVTVTGPSAAAVVTQPDGAFRLDGLPDGVYQVAAGMIPGFGPIPPHSLSLTSGGVARLPAQAAGQVTGAAYEDWDADGRRGGDEPLLTTPLTVTLGSAGATNLAAGRFLFWNPSAGAYDLSILAESVLPAQVTVASGSGSALALPAVAPGVVRGVVWHDRDGDRARAPREAPLSGVTVSLDGATAVTDAHGRYAFYNVSPGSHTLSPTLPAGMAVETVTVTLPAGRGAAVGIPAGGPGHALFLPMIVRP